MQTFAVFCISNCVSACLPACLPACLSGDPSIRLPLQVAVFRRQMRIRVAGDEVRSTVRACCVRV
jgi:hypothetical protein